MHAHTMQIALRLLDGRAQMANETGGLPPVISDAHPPFGGGQGYTPLDLFLMSYADCTATSLLTLLRDRMRRTVTGLEATATGTLRTEHPKAFSHIHLAMTIDSPDATDAEIKRAMASVEKKICAVQAMIRGNVETEVTVTLRRPQA